MEQWERQLNEGLRDALQALTPAEQGGALRRAYLTEGNKVLKSARAAVDASPLGKARRIPAHPRTKLQTARQPVSAGLYRRVFPKGGGFMISAKPYKRNVRKGIHVNLYGYKKPVLGFAADGTVQRSTGRGRKTTKGHPTGRMPKLFDLRAVEEAQAPAVERGVAAEFERNVQRALQRKGLT